jgi:hypothetical protein
MSVSDVVSLAVAAGVMLYLTVGVIQGAMVAMQMATGTV